MLLAVSFEKDFEDNTDRRVTLTRGDTIHGEHSLWGNNNPSRTGGTLMYRYPK